MNIDHFLYMAKKILTAFWLDIYSFSKFSLCILVNMLQNSLNWSFLSSEDDYATLIGEI